MTHRFLEISSGLRYLQLIAAQMNRPNNNYLPKSSNHQPTQICYKTYVRLGYI